MKIRVNGQEFDVDIPQEGIVGGGVIIMDGDKKQELRFTVPQNGAKLEKIVIDMQDSEESEPAEEPAGKPAEEAMQLLLKQVIDEAIESARLRAYKDYGVK